MKTVSQIEAVNFFLPDEGELALIYGSIGNGKTTYAVQLQLDLLNRGQVVYSTFHVDWSGFDQRKSFKHIFMNIIFFRKRFYKFNSSNWHFLDVNKENIWDTLLKLNNCHIFFDDVIVQLFDSYEGTKFSKEKRTWAFTTRHYDRSIYLVTQRPSQVQVALRSQVNRFFKCVKRLAYPFLILSVYEYQDMKGETVDDGVDTVPVSVKTYFPSRRILNAFRSKSLRAEGIEPVIANLEAWDVSLWDKVKMIVAVCFRAIKPESKNRHDT